MIFIFAIFLLLYVFWPDFRTVVLRYVTGSGYWLGTQWTTHRNLLVATLLIIWLVPPIALLAIGSYANSLGSAIVFIIFFPLWIASSIINGLRNLRTVAPITGTTPAPVRTSGGFIRSVLAVVLIIAAINILIGVWSPEFKDALNTWTFFKKQDLAISVNKSTSKMESVVGTNAVITEDGTAMIGASNQFLVYLNKGDEILVPDVKNFEKAGSSGEGYIWIMIKNNQRQFWNGKAGKVPIRLIDYDVAKYRPAASPAPEAGKPNVTSSEVVYDQPVSFNQWTEADKGYIRLIKLEPGWVYTVYVSGEHFPYVKRYQEANYNNDAPMGPDGWNAVSDSIKDALVPLPKNNLGGVIGKIENVDLFIGKNCILPNVQKETDFLASINFGQDRAEGGVHPSLNFKDNKGSLQFKIERKRS